MIKGPHEVHPGVSRIKAARKWQKDIQTSTTLHPWEWPNQPLDLMWFSVLE